MAQGPLPANVSPADAPGNLSLPARLVVLGLIGLALAILWATNLLLTERYTEAMRARAEVRMALYAGNIMSELQRNAVVPLLLSRDTLLIQALSTGDFSATSQRLISYGSEIQASSIVLLDIEGRAVAATDRNQIGVLHRERAHFVEALRAADTVFTVTPGEAGGYDFVYARKVEAERRTLGVIMVRVDLARLEAAWRRAEDTVLVSASDGTVLLASEPRWRRRALSDVLEDRETPNVLERAVMATGEWSGAPPGALLTSSSMLRVEERIPFRGWRLTYLTSYAPVRDRVNGVLALEVMGLAMILSLTFYVLSRRARSQSLRFQRESIDLRRLNARLQREIAEREKVERTLEVAEQTLAQSSKLAVLGEMSAAVSHELNQPLAAMKTYLAGARLLLQRRRPEEALSSFQRIDDLIERMGAITRQLKSFAGKGTGERVAFDLRAALDTALSMMAPQLNRLAVQITRSVPAEAVMVHADRVRIEQVIVNLLRNALDAMRDQPDRELVIILSAGAEAVLSVRDNGPGIKDLDRVFEPFFTTKTPGEGTGLGLAISSAIVSDLGGRLTGRNAPSGGAVFEMRMPRHASETSAA